MLGPAKRIEWSVTIRGRVSKDVVEELSRIRNEPDWMRRLRLRALKCLRGSPGPIGFPSKVTLTLNPSF
jgi:Fe-S cluster assembly protein SufB